MACLACDESSHHTAVLAQVEAQLQDWVTEKIYHALAVGSVPVYVGPPNVNLHLPCRQCVIDASRFTTLDELSSLLRFLVANETAYDRYLDWARTPYDPDDYPEFEHLVRRNSIDTSMCRLCHHLRPGKCNCRRRGCTARQENLAMTLGVHG